MNAPNRDFRYIVVNLILAFLGKGRCRCGKSFPSLMIGRGRQLEIEKTPQSASLRWLKVFTHFLKNTS